MCGAAAEQGQTFKFQQSFANLLNSNYLTEFGDASQIFDTLTSVFSPIVSAGPNQQGFSPGELAAKNSYATDTTAQQYENAAKAVGEKAAAAGGGNTYIPSGADTQMQEEVATAGARQLSGELNQIKQQDYATGRSNWLAASEMLGAAPKTFGEANQGAGEVNTAGYAMGKTANEIAQANNSWMGAVGGILGGAAQGAIGLL